MGGPGVKGKVSAKSPAGGKRPPDINVSQAPSSKKPATDKDGKENVSTVSGSCLLVLVLLY